MREILSNQKLDTVVHHPQNTWHHTSARAQRTEFGKEKYSQAISFAVVRNPNAWVVGGFFFYLSGCCMSLNDGRQSLQSEEQVGVCRVYFNKYCSGGNVSDGFRHFFWDRVSSSSYWHAFATRHPPGIAQLHWGLSQLEWLTNSQGELIVDKIIHLEDKHAYQQVAVVRSDRSIF